MTGTATNEVRFFDRVPLSNRLLSTYPDCNSWLPSEVVSWRVTEVRKLLTIEYMPNQPEVSVVIVSKLTSKAQTTIPQPIRAALGLQPGDELSYEIVDGRVMLTKVQRGTTTDDPFRTFEEWRSEADTTAYADL